MVFIIFNFSELSNFYTFYIPLFIFISSARVSTYYSSFNKLWIGSANPESWTRAFILDTHTISMPFLTWSLKGDVYLVLRVAWLRESLLCHYETRIFYTNCVGIKTAVSCINYTRPRFSSSFSIVIEQKEAGHNEDISAQASLLGVVIRFNLLRLIYNFIAELSDIICR